MTVKDVLAGSTVSDLDAEVLLASVLRRSRTWLLAHPAAAVPAGARTRFTALAKRRAAGEPVAYLTGGKEFYGRAFAVSPDVLCPRPETEDLVERALAVLRPGDAVFDVGTGSGCIGVTIALERPDVSVTLADVSETALAVAKRNARRLGAPVGCLLADGLPEAAREADPRRLVLLGNLPYLRDSDVLPPGEPPVAFAGGTDGLDVIRRFVGQLRAAGVRPRHLFLEHRKSHGAAVRKLLGPQARTHTDLAGLDRVTGY